MKGVYAWIGLMMVAQHWGLEDWTRLLLWLMVGLLLIATGKPDSKEFKDEWQRMGPAGRLCSAVGSVVCLSVVVFAMWRYW